MKTSTEEPSRELLYNNSITVDTLERQEQIDPAMMKVIRYSGPNDEYGFLGNMKGGIPFTALGQNWRSSEHLYLLGEWSLADQEDIQRDVLSAPSGYAAKRYKKAKHKKEIRSDFSTFRHHWMLWTVWQKCSNPDFRKRLLSLPDDAVIVEVEKNDPVWAAEEQPSGILKGANAMGKILTICRRHLAEGTMPPIDTEMLNNAGIYILGHRIEITHEDN